MAGPAISIRNDADGALGDDLPSRQTPFVIDHPDGSHGLALMVDGLRCAGCIGRVEAALNRHAGVKSARVNFSTRKVNIVWEGPATLADRFVADISDLGYGVTPYDPTAMDNAQERERKFLLLCVGVAGFAMGNIMLLSFGLWITGIETMGAGTRSFLHLISAVIAIPAVAFSGRPFFLSAWSVLKKGHTNMDVPISLALILATGVSVYQLFTHAEHAYFDSAVMLMFFLLIGRYLDFQARSRARSAAADLVAMMAATATVIDEAGRRVVPVSALQPGMIVDIAAGERIPADGVVLRGESEVDNALITGESLPHGVGQGDGLLSGMLNLSAPLRMRVEKAAEKSFLADIVRLMEQAEQSQSAYVRLADRVARRYTPVVHTLAAATFLGWFFLFSLPWDQALMIAVTVLIITCPCALGLAVPVVQVLAVGGLMRRGVLVKSGDALERLAAADTVFFDKTGTLTLGRPVPVNLDKIAPDDLRLAAALAARSHHPLSKALIESYAGDIPDIDVREIPGCGLEADIDGVTVRLGNRAWCGLPPLAEESAEDADYMEMMLIVPGRAPVCFLFEDRLRPDAAEMVSALRAMGFSDMRLLSGDRPAIATRVAAVLGIDVCEGGMTPDRKYAVLEQCRAAGKKVLMIGDGLNDAPVLAGAHVSVSPASAADIARNAADIVFTGDRLDPVVRALRVARRSQGLVRQNFILATLYNIVAVPLAIIGMVTPLIAAIAMSSSSLIVIFNSFRLRKSL